MKIIQTIKRAIKFDNALYSEIEQKDEYNNQAILVVVLASLLSAIAIEGFDIFGIIVSFILELICSAVWVAVIVFLALKVLDIRLIPINFARCIGIALFPLLSMILIIVPYIGIYLAIAGIILAIITVFKVVLELLEVDLGMALVLSMIGSVPFIVMNFYLIYSR